MEGQSPGGLPAEDVAIIEHEVRRMEMCIQTFLDFARPPTSERTVLEAGADHPGRSLAIVRRIRARQRGRGDSAVELPPGPVESNIVGGQVQQVLVNFLLNALDAPSAGRQRPTRGTACRRPKSRTWRCEFASGPGIAPRIRERLFEPFVSGKETGLGLGLSISGDWSKPTAAPSTAKTRPAAGRCSRSLCRRERALILLRVSRISRGENHGGSGSGNPARSNPRKCPVPTLLIVDDEPNILLAFRRAFRDGTVEVITASTAAEGLQLAAERRPDAVVLDVHLPDRTGLEMLRKLQAVDARCPVIFITGQGTTDTAIEAMKLGAYEYLLKPLELQPAAASGRPGLGQSAG